jgi:hypothetical protein
LKDHYRVKGIERAGGEARGRGRLGTLMLTPPERQPSRPVPLPLRHSLLGSVAVIVGTAFGIFIVWVVTQWLWLVINQGLH